MRDNLDDALKLVNGDEGGYSNRPGDAGGPTKWGITQKTLSDWLGRPASIGEVKGLSMDTAEQIYRKSYWGQSGGDVLPAGLDYAVFNSAVMSGPQKAVKLLQETLLKAGVYDLKLDGWIGPGTLTGIEKFPGGVRALISAYCNTYMDFLRSLKSKKTGFPVNGRGWEYRITGKDPLGKLAQKPGVVGNALAMASKSPVRATNVEVVGADAKAPTPVANPWTKPEILGPAGALVGTIASAAAGNNAISYALALGVVVAIGLGAFYTFQRIRKAA